MKVKKYVAPSMPEAMKIIRSELGNDAVILNSKIVYTGGFLGFFRKKNIEVIVAIDETPKQKPKVKQKPVIQPIPTPVKINTQEKKAAVVQKDKPSTEVLNEISEMKKLLQQLSTTGQENVTYPEPIQHVNRLLQDQEIALSVREKLLTTLLEKWYVEGAQASLKEVMDWSKKVLVENITPYAYGEIDFSKKYVNVVGPTGVGKTTTLAKIAADSMLKFNKKVAMITTDTYRIAAIEQLKTYAKILSVPIEVCYNLDDFQKACEGFKDYDVVLIDTAGRNFRDPQYVAELKKIIDYDHDMETYLVLALTSKQKDMEDIYQQFSSIPIHQFIFTKLDETSSYGAMYNMIEKCQTGVAYVTNGQNVPDDRVAASAELIVNLLFEEVRP